MRILYNFATRSRREKFFSAVNSIVNNSVNKKDFTILVVADKDDDAMVNEEVRLFIKEHPLKENFIVTYGYSDSKIHAINREVNNWIEKHEIIVNMSDDMFFILPGFDEFIRDDMAKNFPDTDGCLCYWDGNPHTKAFMTMSIMGRKYFERFGYIYHPSYVSVYADNEAVDVAKSLNKYYVSNVQLFEHRHPAVGKAQMDEQYLKTESSFLYALDRGNYEMRKAKNFPVS